MKLQRVKIGNSLEEIFLYIGERISYSSDPTIVILEAGHFSSSCGPDWQAVNTLKGALDLANNIIVEHGKKVRVVLALLVDDLGLSCGIDVCSVGENNTNVGDSLPNELISILKDSSIYKPKQFVISSERAAKNRGIVKLKNIIKRKGPAFGSIFKLEEDGRQQKFFFCSKDGEKVFLADIKDWVWSSRCPLVMGQHYFDLHKKISKRYPYNWPQILIDFSSIHERGKVNRGAELATQFLSLEGVARSYEIVNICFADEEGEVYTVDYFSI
ncbi:MAG: hypothetical protein WC026_16370 [Hyphomicrobium sp.]|uniref:hypothetical protein n=1 Tax=Hyphomicrobium sp. TaxID=82 RepID=UPI00356A4DE5